MITAVDTNVLLDVFRNDPVFGQISADALRRCIVEGRLVACEVVWAETAAAFDNPAQFRRAMGQLDIAFVSMDKKTAELAGIAWQSYRRAGGARQRVMADFLIGAHAQQHAERFLTRDRGFYRAYFNGLVILDPAAENKGIA